MCGQHTSATKWISIAILFVSVVWGTAGCGPRSPQVEIVVSPSMSTLEVGEQIALSANATGSGSLKYQWRLTEPGRLEEPTTDPAVVYRSTEPGSAVVTVEVKDENGRTTSKSYSFVVEDASGGAVSADTSTPPSVNITSPRDTIECPGAGACKFTVEGTSSNVITDQNLRIYVLVFPVAPHGAGWYPQPSPATIRQDGTWIQTPAWMGSDEYPAEPGHTFQIVALVVQKDTLWNGIKPADWPAEKALASYQDISYEAASDIVDLEVK